VAKFSLQNNNNLWPQIADPESPRVTGANTFVPQIRGGYHLTLHKGQIAESADLVFVAP
jgi:hypothetical protein